MESDIGYVELALIEKVAEIFEYAVENRGYEPYSFAEKWLTSDVCQKTLEFDVALCSQSKTYILLAFEDEYREDLPTVNKQSIFFKEEMYWFGYVTAYWIVTEGITGKEISANYNIRKIINEYDVLHTVSVKTAIDLIKEDDAL